jgi:hypothetical protein
MEAWELVGLEYHKVKITPEHTDDIGVYLDFARGGMKLTEDVKIEQRFHRPDLHPLYYGTADLTLYKNKVLDVVDFKFGVGIVKEAKDNEQLLYYARALLDDYPDTEKVVLWIVQPRAWHKDGPIRRWETTPDYIKAWFSNVCLPAIEASEWDDTVSPGEHCRFCPAKLECPALRQNLAVVQEAKSDLTGYDLATLVSLYENFPQAKMLIKAVEKAIYTALVHGKTDPRVKLVRSRSDRVWKDDAPMAEWGEDAFTKPKAKTPAELDKLGPKAKAFTKEWAYSPFTGTTLAPASDARTAITAKSATETFKQALEKLDGP